jgi:MORN repeat variant
MPDLFSLPRVVRRWGVPLIAAACTNAMAAQQTTPSEHELRLTAGTLCTVKRGDTSVTLFHFPSGSLSTCIVQVDNAARDVTERQFHFHDNGRIRGTGYQGRVNNGDISANSSVGTWYEFDREGRIEKSTTYNNDVFSKAFIGVRHYHPNGQLKAIEKYNNYILYETEEKPIGEWRWYDDRGKLVRVVKH